MLGQLLRESKYTVVFTGAGLSTESGLPDFRSSKNGLWNRRNPLELATVEAMEYNRDEFISFYQWRIDNLMKVKPHEGYYILTDWANKKLINSFITQNVDGFHIMSGQKNVAELHGSLRLCHCNSCGDKYPMDIFRLSNNLTCHCGGFIRPSVVLFGESLPFEAIDFAEEEAKKADLFIVLGSSLQVSPANTFPKIAKRYGAKLVIINMESTPLDNIADIVISGRQIGDVLKDLNKNLYSKEKETILKVGAEGGTISIIKEFSDDNICYYIRRNESLLTDFLDDEDMDLRDNLRSKSGLLNDFFEAITELDRYPWTRLSPVFVHKDYRDKVKSILKSKDVGIAVMNKWSKILSLP
ncbi:NAD-dependent deacylase [Microbacteriaceae bacterium 4G12]